MATHFSSLSLNMIDCVRPWQTESGMTRNHSTVSSAACQLVKSFLQWSCCLELKNCTAELPRSAQNLQTMNAQTGCYVSGPLMGPHFGAHARVLLAAAWEVHSSTGCCCAAAAKLQRTEREETEWRSLKNNIPCYILCISETLVGNTFKFFFLTHRCLA